MEDPLPGQIPTFVEHFLVATVADFIEGSIIEDLLRELNTAMALPGVLATHVGRCVPVLGDHTFIMHIRAIDTATCDAAYKAAHEAYAVHLTLHNINTAEDFKDIIIVDFDSQPIGAWGGKIFGTRGSSKMAIPLVDVCNGHLADFTAKWPAVRLAIVKYKPNTSGTKLASLEGTLKVLPTLFPVVKQVSWGMNIARERMYRPNYRYADVDHELGILLGFSCCQDMHTLGADPNYWELLNFHGISVLEKYQVLTLCLV